MTTTARRATLASLLLAAAAALSPPSASAQTDKATVEALESYFDFSDYGSGTLTTEQIPAGDWAKLMVLDVRDAGQFAKGHIPGAVNIEWRRVFAERAKLPKDKTILAYCNTGSFSGQVAMALRMAGFENVRILHGGYGEWKAAQARGAGK
ncbi:MAG: rhodanese-like domain-containing protein [Methylibium sp.]|nr:rhodanese-like domain-containing protein [Methylibium sp.]